MELIDITKGKNFINIGGGKIDWDFFFDPSNEKL